MLHREKLTVRCRYLVRSDMPAVLVAESIGYPDHGLSEEDFLYTLRQRNCLGVVAESCDQVLGHMLYEIWRSRIHLITLAVHPDFQRRGVGAQLLSKLTHKLSAHRRTQISTIVHEGSLGGQLFLHRHGFRATKVLCGRMDDGCDGYVMRYALAGVEDESEIESEVGF